MPPRQPLRLKKPANRSRRPLPINPLATNPLTGAAVQSTAPSRSLPPLNPYPDLTLAIAMLSKRVSGMRQRNPADPRLALVEKWLTSLTKLQADMQQLHKLEALTQRLQPPTPKSS